VLLCFADTPPAACADAHALETADATGTYIHAYNHTYIHTYIHAHIPTAPLCSLPSHALDAEALPGEELEDAAARWGQMVADALAGRRLFARARRAGCGGDHVLPHCASPQDAHCRLQGMIGALLDEALQAASPAAVAAKAEQVETATIASKVLLKAQFCVADVAVLAPSEFPGLVPPWLRSARSEASYMQLASLLLQVRSVPPAPGPAAQTRQVPPTADPTTIVVLGNTGAGKSTLLNAFLGEEELLPTNAMRACTASIIEVLHVCPRSCAPSLAPSDILVARMHAHTHTHKRTCAHTHALQTLLSPGSLSGGRVFLKMRETHMLTCRVHHNMCTRKHGVDALPGVVSRTRHACGCTYYGLVALEGLLRHSFPFYPF